VWDGRVRVGQHNVGDRRWKGPFEKITGRRHCRCAMDLERHALVPEQLFVLAKWRGGAYRYKARSALKVIETALALIHEEVRLDCAMVGTRT